MNHSKYKLAICHLFHPRLHGYTTSSTNEVLGHYLVFWEFEIDEFLENYHTSCIEDLQSLYDDILIDNCPHPIIRNYLDIAKRENYIKIDIVEINLLFGLEEVACIKTFWIKIFQRRWKKEFYKRKKIIQILSNPKYLLKREIQGKIKL